MKKIFLSVGIIFLLILADFNILQHVKIFGQKLDLLIITLIFFNLFLKFNLAFLLTVLAGIVKDILSTAVFGLYTTTFVISAILMNSSVKWIAKENLLSKIIYTFIMVIFILSFLEVSGYIFKVDLIHPKIIFLQFILLKGIIDALAGPFWFKILSRLLR